MQFTPTTKSSASIHNHTRIGVGVGVGVGVSDVGVRFRDCSGELLNMCYVLFLEEQTRHPSVIFVY